jgi:transposase
MDLTDEQWAILKSYLPPDPVRADKRGRPWSDSRKALNGVLWILRTGARWEDLPPRYGPSSTVHDRFQKWRREGVLTAILQGLAEDLRARGKLDLSECFVDATFASAKKGALEWARPSAAKGPRSWQWQTALVFLSPFARRALRQRK